MRAISVCAATGQGVRDRQEDAFVCVPGRGLFAVADGIGGHRDGHVASRLAVEAAARQVCGPMNGLFQAQSVLEAANRAVWDYGCTLDFDERGSPGTTLTGVLLDPHRPQILHCGDSRLYLLRPRPNALYGFFIAQLTMDHAAGGRLLSRLGKDPEDFDASGFEVGPLSVHPGDYLLLATDGLSIYLSDPDDIKREVRCFLDKEGFSSVAQSLVDVCERCGGRDNTTIIFIEVGE